RALPPWLGGLATAGGRSWSSPSASESEFFSKRGAAGDAARTVSHRSHCRCLHLMSSPKARRDWACPAPPPRPCPIPCPSPPTDRPLHSTRLSPRFTTQLGPVRPQRSEEHTSELQSLAYLVC